MTLTRRSWAGGVGAAVAVPLVIAGGALARAPRLLTAGQRSGHLVANWSLPPGVATDQLVAGASGAPDPFFGLAEADWLWWVDGGSLSRTQASFTSPDPFDPGAYYVRVGGIDAAAEEGETEWSNILRFSVPTPPKPPKPPAPKPKSGKYQGRTEFPDSRPVSFTLSRDRRRIRRFKLRFRLDCSQGATPVGQFLARPTFKPISVRRKGWKFKRTGKVRFRQGGRLTITVTGRMRPPKRARGTLTARARLPGGVKCVYFPIKKPKWSARRR